MAAPLVKINGKLYSIDSIIGKQVFASKKSYLYRTPFPEDLKNPQFIVNTGGSLGVVYSWIQKNGVTYLMFTTKSPAIIAKYPTGNYYVAIDAIDEQTLRDQGTKTYTEEEKAKEEAAKAENQSLTDKALNTAKDTLITIAAVYIGGSILKSVLGGNR